MLISIWMGLKVGEVEDGHACAHTLVRVSPKRTYLLFFSRQPNAGKSDKHIKRDRGTWREKRKMERTGTGQGEAD